MAKESSAPDGDRAAPEQPSLAGTDDFRPDDWACWLSLHYRNRLRLFAARRLHDASVAEDAAQETLRRVLDALRQNRLRDVAALPAFVFETARHVCQHWNRSVGRERRALGDALRSGDSEAAASDGDPLRALITAERAEEVRAAVAQLDVEDQRLLTLTYVDALSSAEIGRLMGLTAGNVRVRRHRALRCLAELLSVTNRVLRGHSDMDPGKDRAW